MKKTIHIKNEIVIKNLSKNFENNIIFKDLCLNIPTGQSVGIMGPSGTGKSILLKCILGLIEYEGEIYYKDKLLKNKKRSELFNNSGMLFQGGALFDSLTVWQNIAFKYINSKNYQSKSKCMQFVQEMLTEVELSSEILQLMPSELSGGMQKRVALARAIFNNPNLLFFDEPTTGLDPLTAKVINKLIYKIIRKKDVTSIIISHDPISIKQICDEVIFLIDGNIGWQGKVAEMGDSKNKILNEYTNYYK